MVKFSKQWWTGRQVMTIRDEGGLVFAPYHKRGIKPHYAPKAADLYG